MELIFDVGHLVCLGNACAFNLRFWFQHTP